jgi:hypothetical protein
VVLNNPAEMLSDRNGGIDIERRAIPVSGAFPSQRTWMKVGKLSVRGTER